MTANGYLESLAAFGMRLGLERISALLEELENPQERLDAIHVVGTNGKSSTVRFAAAALTASGLRTGAYLSPHVVGWDERVQIDGRPVGPAALAVALDRVQEAARAVEASLGEGPTQFEALTAAAFLVLAEGGVEACVVEAGLGGRHDATRVINARVVGLTNVGLDHQRVLGDTRELILAEKLAVLEPGAALCVGVVDDALYADAAALAEEAGASCERIAAGAGDGLPLPAAYLRDDAALALRLAELLLAPRSLAREAAEAALARAVPPGRLELIAGSSCDPARRRAQRRGHAGTGAGARRRAGRSPPARRGRGIAGRQAGRGDARVARAGPGCARGHDQRTRGSRPRAAGRGARRGCAHGRLRRRRGRARPGRGVRACA